MSTITPSTTLVSDALALLIEQYKGKPVLAGLITSYTNRLQEIENAIAQILTAYDFVNGTPVGAQLDTIASIVGEKRNGQSDADLLIAVLTRILANNSEGHPNDLIKVGKSALGGVPTKYVEGNAAWSVEANFGTGAYAGLPTNQVLNAVRLLDLAKCGGTRGVLRVAPPAATVARFGDSGGSVSYALFGGSGVTGASLINAQQVTQ